jgi:hypothetical protein
LVQNDINKANERLRAERNHHKAESKKYKAEYLEWHERFVQVCTSHHYFGGVSVHSASYRFYDSLMIIDAVLHFRLPT